jgi:hypothetical protein
MRDSRMLGHLALPGFHLEHAEGDLLPIPPKKVELRDLKDRVTPLGSASKSASGGIALAGTSRIEFRQAVTCHVRTKLGDVGSRADRAPPAG